MIPHPIVIHGVTCFMVGQPNAWRIVRADTGAELSCSFSRLMAVARAAVLLHTSGRRA